MTHVYAVKSGNTNMPPPPTSKPVQSEHGCRAAPKSSLVTDNRHLGAITGWALDWKGPNR